ncbi:hypothetical protein IWZ00DRAFT_548598 [Phyllosticta capitalensis]
MCLREFPLPLGLSGTIRRAAFDGKYDRYAACVLVVDSLYFRASCLVEAQQAPRSPSLFDPASVLSKSQPKARPPLFDPSRHDDRALWIGDLPLGLFETDPRADFDRKCGRCNSTSRYVIDSVWLRSKFPCV